MERGIAAMPLVLITACLIYREPGVGGISSLSGELGRATDIDRLLVSSGLSARFFTLIGKTIFGAVVQILDEKCRQKWSF